MLFNSFNHAVQDEPATARQRENGKVLESAAFEVCKPQSRQNEWLMECKQTYQGTDQNGSRQITD